MARIQILPLPAQAVGSFESTPFVVVLDRLSDHDRELLSQNAIGGLRDSVGAQSILVYNGDLDVGATDPELLAALRADIGSAVS